MSSTWTYPDEHGAVDLALGDMDREGSTGDPERLIERLRFHGYELAPVPWRFEWLGDYADAGKPGVLEATDVIARVQRDAATARSTPTPYTIASKLSKAGLLIDKEQIDFLRSRPPSAMHYVPWWQVNILLLVTNLLVVAANAAKGEAAWFNIAASFVFAGLAVRTNRSLRRHEKEMRR